MSKNRKRNDYHINYRRNNYDTISICVDKGYRKVVKDNAAEHGMSMAQFIVEALEEKIGKGDIK